MMRVHGVHFHTHKTRLFRKKRAAALFTGALPAAAASAQRLACGAGGDSDQPTRRSVQLPGARLTTPTLGDAAPQLDVPSLWKCRNWEWRSW